MYLNLTNAEICGVKVGQCQTQDSTIWQQLCLLAAVIRGTLYNAKN